MFAVIWRWIRKAAAFCRRLVVDQPSNEYERIMFGAAYSIGDHVRKGMAR